MEFSKLLSLTFVDAGKILDYDISGLQVAWI